MGLLSLLKKLQRNNDNEARLLVLGLDNSGKTTILSYLSSPTDVSEDIMPTKGFNVKTVNHQGKISLNLWDIGGQTCLRPYWRNYLSNTSALIYVVDSSDATRMEESRVELKQLLEDEKLHRVPMLIFANKSDLFSAFTTEEITQCLQLADIDDRAWTIHSCSAKTGKGIQEGMEWIVERLDDASRK